MTGLPDQSAKIEAKTFLGRLGSDRSGNTIALIAAAMLPLVGMIGGGVDMSRAYLANSRLQQACDAGVLAARKKLGTSAAVTGQIPDDVAIIGYRFFNVNYQKNSYATKDRQFEMFLEEDYAVTGEASVSIPTTLMAVFGFDQIPVEVKCEANLSFTNADILMALDVTGSMRQTNPDDDDTRINTMKKVVRDFHAEMTANQAPGTRVRMGFLPYATNVNVGHLLLDDWVVPRWSYQSRENDGTTNNAYTRTFEENWKYVSGGYEDWTEVDSYAATFVAGEKGNPGSGDEGGTADKADTYICEGAQPSNDLISSEELQSTDTEPYIGPPSGTKTIEHRRRFRDGTQYRTIRVNDRCRVERVTYTDHVEDFDRVSHPAQTAIVNWAYRPVSFDVPDWRSETTGCIEERSTYRIDDPTAVDFDTALDLNIDMVPVSGNEATQWRPMYPNRIYTRSLNSSGSGDITPEEVRSTLTFAQTGNWWFSHCPAPARALAEVTAADVNTYLQTLTPEGATHHDIGMIWAGRMISPTGIFASANADVTDYQPTNRNIIFLTDGETEAYDIAYGAYGLDAIDQRRWDDTSPLSLVQTVEQRFEIACREIRKKNVTIWVIAFGTEVNDSMVRCAGEGRYFEAANAGELSNVFSKIANSLGDLRITR